MSKIRESLKSLIQACNDEGLNPSITLWFHNHIQDGDFTEESALDLISSITKLAKEEIKLDYTTLRNVNGSGLIFESTFTGTADVCVNFPIEK